LNVKITKTKLLIFFLVIGIISCIGYASAECIFKVNGKYGLKDKNGKTIIKPIYDKVRETPEGLIVIIKNSKLGLADKQGKILVEPKYKANLLEYKFHFSDGVAAVIKETKNQLNNCVYIDKTGKEVLDPTKYGYSTVQDGTYGSCSDFSEGLAPVCFGKWTESAGYWKDFGYGYINKEGKLVINLKNVAIDDQMCGDAFCLGNFKNGVASIAVNGKWRYIDKQGKIDEN
jgi:hypothetical protein